MLNITQREKTEKTASVPNYYSLLVGGRDTDYTTEGKAVALIACGLRAQVRQVEVQAVTVGRTGDSRPPGAAGATYVVQNTIV